MVIEAVAVGVLERGVGVMDLDFLAVVERVALGVGYLWAKTPTDGELKTKRSACLRTIRAFSKRPALLQATGIVDEPRGHAIPTEIRDFPPSVWTYGVSLGLASNILSTRCGFEVHEEAKLSGRQGMLGARFTPA